MKKGNVQKIMDIMQVIHNTKELTIEEYESIEEKVREIIKRK